jgi:hypothetical protein
MEIKGEKKKQKNMEGTGNGEPRGRGNVWRARAREREREGAREDGETRDETVVVWVCARIFARLAVPSRDLSRRHLCLLSFIAGLP